MDYSSIKNSFDKSKKDLNLSKNSLSLKNDSDKIKKPNIIEIFKPMNKLSIIFLQLLLVSTFFSTEISCFEYCCCLFSKDPFRGYTILKSQILSFDHLNMDKESIGYKMINQCYRTYNGFPTLENINSLKRDVYTIDKRHCDKDCNYLTREINEKYNIKQETNREADAKRLKEIRKKFLNILNRKIKENTNSLHNGKPCTAQINTCSNWKGSNCKQNKRYDKKNHIKIINTTAIGNLHLSSGSIDNVPTIADLSIDSDNDNEQSYLELENPKYNIELKNEDEKKSKKVFRSIWFIFLF